MKTMDSEKHHKVHKHTISGFVIGGLLLTTGLMNMLLLEEPRFHPMASYISLAPGILIILRSLHPPMGVIRFITTFVGGVMVGTLPMILSSENPRTLTMGLGIGLVGAVLLGISFTTKPPRYQ